MPDRLGGDAEDILGGRLVANRAQCLICYDTIESVHRHDYVTCSCGNLSVDGGLAYTRRVYRFSEQYWEELSIYRWEDDGGRDECDI